MTRKNVSRKIVDRHHQDRPLHFNGIPRIKRFVKHVFGFERWVRFRSVEMAVSNGQEESALRASDNCADRLAPVRKAGGLFERTRD